jgi:hypothetical protein
VSEPCSDLILQVVSMIAATVQAVALAYISYRYGRHQGQQDSS